MINFLTQNVSQLKEAKYSLCSWYRFSTSAVAVLPRNITQLYGWRRRWIWIGESWSTAACPLWGVHEGLPAPAWPALWCELRKAQAAELRLLNHRM